MMMYMDFKVAGTSFKPHPENLQKVYDLLGNEWIEWINVQLYHEINNEDPNAFSVYLCTSGGSRFGFEYYKIGYVPRSFNLQLARIKERFGSHNIGFSFAGFNFMPGARIPIPVGANIRIEFPAEYSPAITSVALSNDTMHQNNYKETKQISYLDKITKSRRKIILEN